MALHCAANLVVVPHDRIPPDRADELVEALGSRRLAAVHVDGDDSAAAAATVAARHCLAVTMHPELSEPAEGEHQDSVLDRYRQGLEAIADLHRGETVLVVVHPGLPARWLPQLVRGGAAETTWRGGLIEVRVDEDGITVASPA